MQREFLSAKLPGAGDLQLFIAVNFSPVESGFEMPNNRLGPDVPFLREKI